MGWFKDKFFGSKKCAEQEFAENLYQVMALEGGPSGDADSHIDATTLEIPLGRLERFAQKRLISLEAMLFVAAQLETAERSEKLQEVFGGGHLHPFAIEMGKLIARKWREREIEIDTLDVGERCFDEIEEFLEKPARWSRNWLNEFYDDTEKSGEHYISWTEQWLKEFNAMRNVIAKYS